MRKICFLLLFFVISSVHASPALYGLTIITDKGAYVPNETVQIQNSVFYGIGNPAYGVVVNNTVSDPGQNITHELSCTTNREGICINNFTIQGDYGEWAIFGITELTGIKVNNTVYFNLHEEVCGDGVCDINEPSYCEEDCGKSNGEPCSNDGDCYSETCCQGICRDNCPVCGDGYCDEEEDCVQDCGEEFEEIISSQGSGFFENIGLKVYMENYFEAFQNSFVEQEVIVENLMNSTQKNTTLSIHGIQEFNIVPNNHELLPLSNQTFLLSIPILAGEDAGNKTINVAAISNISHSREKTIIIKIKQTGFNASESCSLQECQNFCCENYVCCEGICRTQCPVCGDSVCSSGENCLSCEEDCEPCQTLGIRGNRTLAINMIARAENTLEKSHIVIFQSMLNYPKNLLEISKNRFQELDYDSSYEYAELCLEKTENIQIYEIGTYSAISFCLVIIAGYAFNKFYKSRKAKKNHGRSKSKKRNKD